MTKESQRGALTDCGVRREGQVRILKESQRETGTHQLSRAKAGESEDTIHKSASEDTHFLSSAEGGTSKDIERK
jgi:hypothetical protein